MQPQTKKPPSRTRHFLTYLILLVWFSLIGAAIAGRGNIIDWLKLKSYEPPAAVAQIAAQDTMTDLGRKIFYVNHPAIQDKQHFFEECPSGQEKTIVLGCYHSGQNGIFLQNVADPRLDGVKQVTAAHEMLHGAYERLSASEKKRVDKLLQDYYHNGLHDERLQETMDAYKKSEPNDLVNEMHSVFGTEVANLPPALEQYYQRYFINRAQVAALAAQYQGVFTSRQTLVAYYDRQLTGLKSQIGSLEAELKSRLETINGLQSTLTADRDNGNSAAYNAAVPRYNAQVNTYNSQLRQINSLIEQYNEILAARNQLAFEQNQIFKELSNESNALNR
jgi:hypothetical protein